MNTPLNRKSTGSTTSSVASSLLSVALLVGSVGAPVGVGLLGGASPAAAQEGQRDMKKAKEFFTRGKRLYSQKNYLEAAKAFKKAYQFSGKNELLYNIGQSYRRADQLRKAEDYFQQYLNENPNASNADKVVEAVIELQEAIAARMASLKIETSKEGRDVFVDDEKKPRCTSPCSVSIHPGVHKITVQAEGWKPFEKSVALSRSENQTLRVTLEEDIQPGRLAVTTGQRAGAVTVAGVGDYSLPLSEPVQVEPGTYNVRVTGEKGEKWSGKVDVDEGETARLFVPLDAAGKSGGGGGSVKRSIAFGLGGASLALFGGGAILGLQANDTFDTLSARSRTGAVNPDLVQKGKAEQQAANILLGAGTATLVSGAGLFVWDLVAGGNKKKSGGDGKAGLKLPGSNAPAATFR